MDKSKLLEYLSAMDEALAEETELVVYGSAAFILKTDLRMWMEKT